MLWLKIRAGVLRVMSGGETYIAQPSTWERLRLLWMFRNFPRLSEPVLSQAERALVEKLFLQSRPLAQARGLSAGGHCVIGTVERTARAPKKPSGREAAPARSTPRGVRARRPVADLSYLKQAVNAVSKAVARSTPAWGNAGAAERTDVGRYGAMEAQAGPKSLAQRPTLLATAAPAITPSQVKAEPKLSRPRLRLVHRNPQASATSPLGLQTLWLGLSAAALVAMFGLGMQYRQRPVADVDAGPATQSSPPAVVPNGGSASNQAARPTFVPQPPSAPQRSPAPEVRPSSTAPTAAPPDPAAPGGWGLGPVQPDDAAALARATADSIPASGNTSQDASLPATPTASAPEIANSPNTSASPAASIPSTPAPVLANPPRTLIYPDYPPRAWAARKSGEVRLRAQVGGDGRVTSVQVLSGDPLLAEAAARAVKRWRYTASPAPAESVVRFKFINPEAIVVGFER